MWAYAKGNLPDAVAPLPLAVFAEPCPYREAALAALATITRPWRIAVVSPSVAGLRAAAAAALAVSPRTHKGPREVADLTNEIRRAAIRKRGRRGNATSALGGTPR